MEIGIIGLPASGKTVVFNALSQSRVPESVYFGGASREPNRAVVKVPDERLWPLTAMFKPRKTIQAEVRYVDVSGLAQGSGREGAATTALAPVREADALLIVLRAFTSDMVAHPLGSIDPIRDLEVVATELVLSDLDLVERRLERLERESRFAKSGDAESANRQREHNALNRVRLELTEGRPARNAGLSTADARLLRGYTLLSLKPWLVLVNSGDPGEGTTVVEQLRKSHAADHHMSFIELAGRVEMEMMDLEPEEVAEFRESWGQTEAGLASVIKESYRLLDLISFLTVGEDEVRAWPIRNGSNAVDAASSIHTAIGKSLIRAEIVTYDQLVEAGSIAEARRKGWLRLEGREYLMRDGDVANFLSNA